MTIEELQFHTEYVRRAAEDVAQSSDSFMDSIDRDSYSALLSDVDRLVRTMKDLESRVPAHWQLPGVGQTN